MSCLIDFDRLRQKSILDRIDDKLLFIDFPIQEGLSQRTEVKINDDILLAKNDLYFQEKTTINFEFDEPVFHLNLSLDKNSSYNYISNVYDYRFNIQNNYTNINYMNNEKGNINIESNSKVKAITLEVKEKFVLTNLLNENNEDSSKCLKSKKSNIHTQIAAQDIFNSPYNGKLNQVYLQSKVLEILFFEFKDINVLNEKQQTINNVSFSNYDIEALHHAKDLLIKNMQNPPSIVDLAKLVHINEFKLKLGFKKLFNLTPYNLLLEYRMQEAKVLLETSDLNINEIAQAIGYKYSQNFSNAFYKRFEVRPKDIMKTRKYYY